MAQFIYCYLTDLIDILIVVTLFMVILNSYKNFAKKLLETYFYI